ncbi:MAG: hypothetical protein AMJ79_01515 [Phycisphaerae bacterium SM23_30]|nr:MAG: hypothetical protein AMJ79_01515 [Phycisphaerae bacterium SM23_30]
MSKKLPINFVEGLLRKSDQAGREAYRDRRFCRNHCHLTLSDKIDAEVIIDAQPDSKITLYHLSFSFTESKTLEFQFHPKEVFPGASGLLLTDRDRRILLWFPQEPYYREYNRNHNITRERRERFHQKMESNTLTLSVEGAGGGKIEFPVMAVQGESREFLREIRSFEALETQRVSLGFFFDYQNLNNAWDYIVNGKIYHPLRKHHTLRWACQQCAFTLYCHLTYLSKQTHKRIYEFLRNFVAYSVMLSLPDNGRWRHGPWSDAMETHNRHQLDGVFLLLDYYRQTKHNLFLQKAQAALEYVIESGDKWPGAQMWFFHDSLESEPQHFRSFYHNDFLSRAFDKSVSNSLCLNTHLWCLAALSKLNPLVSNDRYNQYYQKGAAALKEVLEARRGEVLYRVFYGLRDGLIRFRRKKENRLTRKLQQGYDNLMTRHILPFLKKNYPRLAMPNGYLERDLTHSRLSDFYHMQNIKDLLLLYQMNRSSWLRNVITKSCIYTHRVGLIKNLLQRRERRVIIFADVLLLYGSMINENAIILLAEYLHLFQRHELPFPIDARAHTLMADYEVIFKADNPELFILPAPGNENITAWVVNPRSDAQRTTLHGPPQSILNKYKAADDTGAEWPLQKQVVVPGQNYLKIIPA